MNNFEKAIEFVLGWEVGRNKEGKIREDGGFVVDTGGDTKWGISSKANPDLDVPNLSREAAVVIYRVRYWQPLGCDMYKSDLATTLFDTGVNCGVGRTLRWLNQVQSVPGVKDVAKSIVSLREGHYFNLKTLDEAKYGKYMKGWLRRTNDLKKYIDILRLEKCD